MNRNKKYKKVISVTLCVALAAELVLPAYADEEISKDENIYVNLEQDGSVSEVYVVNEYILDEDTGIVDYGNYSSVRNLSSEEEIRITDDKVTVNAASGKFLYQGKLEDAVLPWLISISYILDGKEMTADELAGARGHLEIQIHVEDNPDSEDEFFDNYLMQATVTLDTDQCSNITAEGATEANVGKDRQLLYNIMAGQEKEFTIKADVTDFEMEAISFQAVPMSFDIDSDSIEKDGLTEKTDEIRDAAEKFDDGAKSLDDGVGELQDGAADLLGGLDTLNSGAVSADEGAGRLTEGVKQLSEGAESAAEGSASLKSGTEELSESLGQMQQGAGELKEGFNTLVENSPQLIEGSAEVKSALEQIQASLNSIEVGTEQMQTLLDSSSKILEGIAQAEEGAGQVAEGLGMIQGSYDGVNALKTENSNAAAYLSGLVSQANTALGSLSDDLLLKIAEMAGGVDIEEVIENVSAIAGLLEQDNSALENFQNGVDRAAQGASGVNAGLEALSSQYKLFDEQIQSLPVILENMVSDEMQPLKDAIDILNEEYGKLDTGINGYTEGISGLQSGYDLLNDALGQATEGAGALAEGAEHMASGNSSLLEGIKELYSGSAALYAGINALAFGAGELKDGAGELGDGVSELKSGTEELLEGTGTFADQVSDIDSKIDKEIDKAIDKIAGSDFEAVSFVSEKNTNIGLVQFVMQTDGIAIQEETEEETEIKEENIWEKIKDLF